ncbi:MAG: protein-L-isoaspartate(D-aspartate) O-methyltransferase [Candidatus Omnitrophica bacterium]|nr:protein-L-isoaspartate(D-aspartate) O-methyltransferase [Candidatus Omnitrophota bacterium]
MNYEALRKMMVREQMCSRGIKDSRVIGSFLKVERHKFIPEKNRNSAYADHPVPIGEGQTISQPYIAALMTECLELKGNERILEIGTGSGYQAAILAELAKEVFSVERFPTLAQQARSVLEGSGYSNIKIKVEDGTLGWKEEAPFDRIIVTAAGPEIPQPLIDQLEKDGKLIMPIGETYSQVLTVVEMKNGELVSRGVCGCVFVPLVGKFGQGEA